MRAALPTLAWSTALVALTALTEPVHAGLALGRALGHSWARHTGYPPCRRGRVCLPQDTSLSKGHPMHARLLAPLLGLALSTGTAFAGSPHFTACTASVARATVTVEGKETGLGGESQVHLVLTAEAACINHGGHHPSADNKTSVVAEGTFPVQNGKALFALDATATFQPDCSKAMDVVISAVSVCDDAHGVCCALD